MTPKPGIKIRLLRNVGWAAVSEILVKSLFFFANIYLARVLGVENFGLFAFAQTITLYFWFAVDLGTNMYGIREIARHKDRAEEIASTILTMRVSAGVLVFVVYTIAIMLSGVPEYEQAVFMYTGLYLLTFSINTEWVCKGIERFELIAIGNVVSAVTFFGGLFFIVSSGKDTHLAAALWSVSFLAANVILIAVIRRKASIRFRPDFRFSLWWHHFRESMYFTLSGVLFMVYQYLPIVYIKYFSGAYGVGLFSAPQKVILSVAKLASLMTMSLYPIFSETFIHDRTRFHRLLRVYQFGMAGASLPLVIAGFVFASDIIGLLFGAEYAGSVPIFRIYVWWMPLFFFRTTYGVVIQAGGFTRHHNVSMLLGALSMCIFGYILVSRYGAVGGAWALLISELVMDVALVVIAYKTVLSKKYAAPAPPSTRD